MKQSIKLLLVLFLVSSLFTNCKKDSNKGPEEEPEETEKDLLTKVPTETPSSLYLIQPSGTSVELTKDGSAFSSPNYISLEQDVDYSFNTKADGTGTAYLIAEPLSAYDYADDDKVIWDDPLLEVTQGKGHFNVARSQAYKLSVDFSKAQLTWQYYNIKLFYYTDWEQRTEVLLSYKHPFTFEKTLTLPADNNMKFYSVNPDWYEWGAADENSFTGTIGLFEGKDIIAVKEAANYQVSITLDNDLETGTYSFTKQ
ncbi:MAG: hypothetical protein EOP46_16510 [Sphingobacteriaceae bacterium]|nr:MAG: hypothetical protein EOP46_16510 [Sphingobacteriaceae bacterium]